MYWIVTGEQCRSGRRAHGLHVGALENDSLPGELLHVGGDDLAVVPRDIMKTCKMSLYFEEPCIAHSDY